MSTRHSSRTTKAVKYTSASEGSDFDGKKKKKKTPKKSTKTPTTPKKQAKKRTAPDTEDDDKDDKVPLAPMSSSSPSKTKRQKKDPTTLGAEARQKADAQEAKAVKASAKKNWEAWLDEHNIHGELLATEPAMDEAITQTNSLKCYGLKPAELGPLLRFEKKNPQYGGTMKLFVEDDVKELAFRKLGMLAGIEGHDKVVVDKGEKIWKEEHKDAAVEHEKSTKTEKQRKKTPKQDWSEYIIAHSLGDDDDDDNKLAEEPTSAINQTKSKAKYSLTPQDLACLPYFPKKNVAYGNTAKVFDESKVKLLAYRKTAILAGVDKELGDDDDDDDDVALLNKGKEMLEE